MFHFIDFKSTGLTLSQDQGKLFERLVREIVSGCGYKDIELRAKMASMEYDILARGKLDNVPLVGEAKAHTKKIDGTTISSFIGKMVPFWGKEARTLGLFISTSDLTPDAKDYLRSVEEQKWNFKVIVGQQILDILANELSYLTLTQVKNKSKSDFNTRAGDTLFLVSDRGDFFVQLLIRKDETRPRAFCVYHSQGAGINDLDFGRMLKSRIPELEELLFWPPEIKGTSFLDFDQSRIAPLQGTGWFDYKFPAPPDCFIGRDEKIKVFNAFLDDFRNKKSKVSVFQVLSRSGVGKSSFLLRIRDELDRHDVLTVIVDARNFRSNLDFLDLIQDFVKYQNKRHSAIMNIPDNLESGFLTLQEIDVQLQSSNNAGVFFIDQFESLFSKPDLYATFIDLLMSITHLCTNILFCIARKNDQPTTYDERAKIDLEYLREISETITLEDFSRNEAISLINHVQDEIGQPLVDRLKEMALEFSQGFPWLQKRICAHIINLIRKGSSQDELVQAGLKPEELFGEELADLDETDKDFIRRVVYYLPATISELHEVFGDGEALNKRINTLQTHRLIRLTGRTYDTYNDVLKEYLKTGSIPFGIKYVFRTSPVATLNLLDRIINNNWKTLTEIREKERKSIGFILNRLRELRLLGLIDYSRGKITPTEVTIQAYQNERIGQLLQNRVRQNGLVKDTLDRIAVSERIKFRDLIDLMKASMPLLDVSEDTWDIYAKNLSVWLDKTGLASLSGKDLVPCGERKGITREELTRAGGTSRTIPSAFFLPAAYINELFAVMELVRQASLSRQNARDAIITTHKEDALDNCLTVGLISRTSEGDFLLTSKGKRFLANADEAKETLKEFLISKPNVARYLEIVGHNPSKHLQVLKKTLADANPTWTDDTWGWRSKVLVNWLFYAELVKRKKGKVTSYPQRLF
jgi:hypothetical protein